MKESEVIQIVLEYFEGLFPKYCSNCHHCFSTLKEYIRTTKRIGATISYDAEFSDVNTLQLIGTVAYVNCPCGNTLALSTQSMPLPQRIELLNWIKSETQQRNITPSELLDYIRDEIRRLALAKQDQESGL